MLRGAVFDLDGTIILSHHDFPRMRAEVVRTAEAYGIAPERLTAKELVGTSQILDAARRELRASAPETLPRFDEDVGRLLDRIEMEALTRTNVRAGAAEMLGALRHRGLRLGLFTRSSEGFCRASLEQAGLREFFPHVRTRSEPGPVKPDPEALHLLLRAMDVPPGSACFVGDHLEDARCAARAGVVFYGVLPDPDQPNPTTADQFLAFGAAAVAADLTEVAQLLDPGPTDGRRSRRR